MNKGKWILLGCLMLIPILVKTLLSNLGKQLTSETEIWLLLAIISLFVVNIAIPKEQRKWFRWFCILFFLLAFTAQFCKKAPETKKGKQQYNPQQTTLVQSASPASNSQVTEIEVTGKNPEGDVFLVENLDGPGCYEITHVEGTKIYDNLQEYLEKSAYDIWGTDYIPSRKHYFPYASIPGVQALEALIIADGEINGPKQVCQFPDCKRTVRIYAEQYLRIIWHGTFRPDINGDTSWDFRDNYGAWKFRIKKVN